MARWWSSSASDRPVARFALATFVLLAVAACGHDATQSASDASVPPVASDDAPAGTLPAPAATPGTAVTGMPTQPPPPPADTNAEAGADAAPAPDATAVAPADTATDSGGLPAPIDETTPTDSTTATAPSAATNPSATSATPAPAVNTADAGAAAAVINTYMAALTASAPARAQSLWATTPNDSSVLQLARGTTFNVDIGAPTADAAGHVTVPVDVRGKADDGGDRHVQAVYTLQRTATGLWRIYSATTRDAAP